MIALTILGIIAIIVGVVIGTNNSPIQKFSGLFKIVGIAIIIAGIAFSSIKQIEPGEVGVQKLFGKVNNQTLESGLNLVNPLVEVVSFDIRTQNYTMSGVHNEGDKAGDDAIRVLSADGLEVIIDLTVLYKVLPISFRIRGASFGKTL